nr:LacI family DNA-binding transcriptional regulator [Nitrospirillum iridis]
MAGVSQSAVSRTFTKGASVSKTTRAAVMAAAAQLGYRPNLIARSLITGRSNIVGVVMAHFDNQFFPPLLQALSFELGKLGYHLLLFLIPAGADFEPVLDDILRHRVEALIMTSVALSESRAELCRAAGLKVLQLNSRTDSPDIASITGDNAGGAATIAAYLAASQHRRYAMITGMDDNSASRDREAAYTRWLESHGLGAPTRIRGDYSLEGAAAAARTLFSGTTRPDAVFCVNDHTALAVLGVARAEFGLEPGRDVSIIGFDDAPIAAWPEYRLTTYSQPLAALVDATTQALASLLDGTGAPAEQVVVTGQLVVRASARRPATGIIRDGDGREIWVPGS